MIQLGIVSVEKNPTAELTRKSIPNTKITSNKLGMVKTRRSIINK